jgi:DNA (cytosine-5)-methyltransferase 1
MKTLSSISLFSGAGGMDVGFERSGFSVEWANDLNKAASETYALNHPGKMACGPIQDFLDTLSQYSGVDLVFGGPPCQGFSVAGRMDPEDERSQLIWRFFDAVERTRPAAFVCENVKALATLTKWSRVRRRMFERAIGLGYECQLVVLDARQFGVSQGRERMFLLGSRVGRIARVEGAFDTHKRKAPVLRTLFKGLGKAGGPSNSRTCSAKITMAASPVMRRSPYAGMLFNGQGRPLNPDGYASTMHASMGGNKTPIIDELHFQEEAPSWIEWYHSHLMKGGAPLGFEEAPDRLRRLTLDEAIRIQTFPSDYKFHGRQSQIFTQVGNAVPCDLAWAVGKVMREVLTEEQDQSPIRATIVRRAQLELTF